MSEVGVLLDPAELEHEFSHLYGPAMSAEMLGARFGVISKKIMDLASSPELSPEQVEWAETLPGLQTELLAQTAIHMRDVHFRPLDAIEKEPASILSVVGVILGSKPDYDQVTDTPLFGTALARETMALLLLRNTAFCKALPPMERALAHELGTTMNEVNTLRFMSIPDGVVQPHFVPNWFFPGNQPMIEAFPGAVAKLKPGGVAARLVAIEQQLAETHQLVEAVYSADTIRLQTYLIEHGQVADDAALEVLNSKPADRKQFREVRGHLLRGAEIVDVTRRHVDPYLTQEQADDILHCLEWLGSQDDTSLAAEDLHNIIALDATVHRLIADLRHNHEQYIASKTEAGGYLNPGFERTIDLLQKRNRFDALLNCVADQDKADVVESILAFTVPGAHYVRSFRTLRDVVVDANADIDSLLPAVRQ